MNKAETALRQKLARMRQEGGRSSEKAASRAPWEQLLDKALQPGQGSTAVRPSLPPVQAPAPHVPGEAAADSPEIGVWSTGPGVKDEDAGRTIRAEVTESVMPENEVRATSTRVATVETGPENLVIIRPDSLGDLILCEPVLRILSETWPNTRIHMLVTPAAEAVSRLIPGSTIWHQVPSASPFLQPGEEALKALREVVGAIQGRNWLLSACSRKTWWDLAVPAFGSFERQISLGQFSGVERLKDMLRRAGLVEEGRPYTEWIPVEQTDHEGRRGLRCASYLLGCAVPEPTPRLRLPEEDAPRVGELLRELGLEKNRYIACCPAGIANVAIKLWPAARFAEALARIAPAHELSVLLLGGPGEAGVLEEISRQAEGSGVRIRSWLGSTPGDFILLCGLLASSRLYLGNDTGAMHAAAALGCPVVSVFGGGTWPRFVPQAASGAAIVRPMPCFGCDWQCHFGDAPCIRLIDTDTVVSAADMVLSSGPGGGFSVIESTRGRTAEYDELGRCATIHALSQAGWRDHLTQVSQEQEAYINQLKAQLRQAELEAAERLKTIFEQDRLLGSQSKEAPLPSSNVEEELAALRTALLDRENRVALTLADLAGLRQQIAGIEGEREELRAALSEAQSFINQLERLYAAALRDS